MGLMRVLFVIHAQGAPQAGHHHRRRQGHACGEPAGTYSSAFCRSVSTIPALRPQRRARQHSSRAAHAACSHACCTQRGEADGVDEVHTPMEALTTGRCGPTCGPPCGRPRDPVLWAPRALDPRRHDAVFFFFFQSKRRGRPATLTLRCRSPPGLAADAAAPQPSLCVRSMCRVHRRRRGHCDSRGEGGSVGR
jgi:hypothetical protein